MIMLTKEQLADLLREAYSSGFKHGAQSVEEFLNGEPYLDIRERAIQPLVHRSSGGHDDNGREVK